MKGSGTKKNKGKLIFWLQAVAKHKTLVISIDLFCYTENMKNTYFVPVYLVHFKLLA
jgi:hypothetical protein